MSCEYARAEQTLKQLSLFADKGGMFTCWFGEHKQVCSLSLQNATLKPEKKPKGGEMIGWFHAQLTIEAVAQYRSERRRVTMAYKWLATLALAVLANGQVDIRGELKQCLQDGEDLNECLRELANSFKPYMKTGFPELGIPKADPLFIDQIKFDLKNPLIDVNVDFTNTNVRGLSTHDLIYIKADKAKKTIAIKMFIPASTAKGLYVIKGKVAVLELDAQPPAEYRTEFSDTTVEGVAQLKVENGRLVIDGEPDIKIDLGGLNIKMDNLFGGKADSLAKTVDKFLNQNTDKFIKDFQPAIAKSVSGFMKGFYNSAVANIDLDAFE